MKKLFINGDSFSAPQKNHKVYGDYLAEKLQVDVINYAMPGSSNARIIRTTVDFIIENGYDYCFILALSYVNRHETWATWLEDKTWAIMSNLNKNSNIKLITEDFVVDTLLRNSSLHKQDFLTRNSNKEIVYLYKDLWLLKELLKKNNSKYLFFSGAPNINSPDVEWWVLNELYTVRELKKDENYIDIFEFNMPKWAEENNLLINETKHLEESAHEKFADFLIQNYINL